MAVILNASIDLTKIPKGKIIDGKKGGKYLPISIHINDGFDDFGNQGYIVVAQSKEERTAKEKKVYLGNMKAAWTNGNAVEVAPRDSDNAPQELNKIKEEDDDDLPF